MTEKLSFLKLPIEIDVGRLAGDLEQIPESEWRPSPWRVPHGSADMILLRGGSTGTEADYHSAEVADRPVLDRLGYLTSLLGPDGPCGPATYAFLTRMQPGGVSQLHRDADPAWVGKYRIHVPIETNRDALLVVERDGSRVGMHLAVGEAWTFDNQQLHGVLNGDRVRTHLVFDVPADGPAMRGVRDRAEHFAGTPISEYDTRRLTEPSAAAESYGAVQGLIDGWYHAWIVFATVRLGLPELLDDEPVSLDRLAARCGADAASLQRLLEALNALGMARVWPDGYSAAPPLHFLRPDAAGGLRERALLGGARDLWTAWEGLPDAVRTGRTAFEAVHGTPIFEHLDRQPELRRLLQGNWGGSPEWNRALASSYDFSRHRSLVDVGGGDGALTEAILGQHPRLEATVFDRHAVIGDRAAQSESGARRLAGDFFAAVPPGADAYLLRSVLHDWDDHDAARILTNCREAMADDGRVLVLEVLHTPGYRSPAALQDLTMLVLTGGRERTVEEYLALLERADLQIVTLHPTPTGLSIIEARPAET